MTGDGRSEDIVIETALIFYRQHLIKELQKCEISFSIDGSLPYSRADIQKQDAFHHQLQSVTNIIESRRRNHTSEPPRSPTQPQSDKDAYGRHEKSYGSQQAVSPPEGLERQNSVPSLPEVLSPSHGRSISRGAETRAWNHQVKELNTDGTNHSQTQAPSINLAYDTPEKVAAFELPKESSSAGDDVMTQEIRDPYGQSTTSSNISSRLEQPTAQANPLDSNLGSPSNLYPPVPGSKRGSPASSVTSHEIRHVSTPSGSTDEISSPPNLKGATYPEQPLSPPPPPPTPPKVTVDNTPKVRLRTKPSFHVSALASMANDHGNSAQPASSTHAEQQLRSIGLQESPHSLGIHPPLSIPNKQRKPLNNNVNGNMAMRPEESNSFPPLLSAKQSRERPSSESFSLPVQSNKVKAADGYWNNTESAEKNRFSPGALSNQYKLSGSFASRASSDGEVLNQQSLSNSHSRNLSSQAAFSSSKSSHAESPFQSTSAFSKKPDFPKSSLEEPGRSNIVQQANTISPNQLNTMGPVPSGIRRTQNSTTRKAVPEAPERPAPVIPQNFNGISPNQLKPARLAMGQGIDAGPVLQDSDPRAKFNGRPRSPQDGFDVNKIRSKGLAGRPNASSKMYQSASFSDSRSKFEEDQQLAQVVADLADQDEMAMLKKMQDEWNRDEDRREAIQGSYTQDLQQNHSEVHRNFDPAQFARSPDRGRPASNIGVQPIRSIPAQNKRRPDISGPSENKTIEAISHLVNSIEIPSTASNPSSLPKHKDLECTVCGDALSNPSETATLPCNHTYHLTCLASGFQHALAGGKLFICCKSLPAPIDTIPASLFPPNFVTKYKAKIIERSTPNPIYCAKPGCATFVPPDHITGPLAKCPKCQFVTCKMCRNPEHKGVCPPDESGGMLMKLAGNKNWTQCQRCKSMVERHEGCLHMTCTCGHEFCYNCGNVWEGCRGRCPRKS